MGPRNGSRSGKAASACPAEEIDLSGEAVEGEDLIVINGRWHVAAALALPVPGQPLEVQLDLTEERAALDRLSTLERAGR